MMSELSPEIRCNHHSVGAVQTLCNYKKLSRSEVSESFFFPLFLITRWIHIVIYCIINVAPLRREAAMFAFESRRINYLELAGSSSVADLFVDLSLHIARNFKIRRNMNSHKRITFRE